MDIFTPAIHEKREDFIPTKWFQPYHRTYLKSRHRSQILNQVWFPGTHLDLGGGNENHDLGDVSLVWMVVCHRLPTLPWDFLSLSFFSCSSYFTKVWK